jgi:uncharacterized protein
MIEQALPLLRCPIDPNRESTLERVDQSMVCRCAVKFPVRQGLPILLSTEAELPEGCRSISQLPCQKKGR